MNEINGGIEYVAWTHKCPTGLPPREGVGHANQKIPLAAHVRSTFLSTFVILFFNEEMFLWKRKSAKAAIKI